MKRALLILAVGAFAAAPADGAAQAHDGWWAPVSRVLQATSPELEEICRQQPNRPVCRIGRAGDTAEPRDPRDSRDDDRGRDRADREDDDRSEEGRARRGGRGEAGRRGNGPPFCRDGGGHPVHGREWCRDKGWGDDVAWNDVAWGDIVLGPRPDTRRRDATLDRGGLLDVLGRVILGRLEQHPAAGSGRLTGRLLEGNDRVLQVRAGSVPLAELVDLDRDGRVDRVLVRGPR